MSRRAELRVYNKRRCAIGARIESSVKGWGAMKAQGLAMKIGSAVLTVVLIAGFAHVACSATQCDERAFGAQIDQTAQALRTLNRDSEVRFQERLIALAKAQGWTDGQKADKAAAAMDDTKLEAFNAEIEDLVSQLDALNVTPKNGISCARLDDLKAVNDKLVGVMRRKAGFILAQLEAQAASAPISPYPAKAPVEKLAPLPRTAATTPAPSPEQQPASPSVPWSANVAKALRPQGQPAPQQMNAAPPAPAPTPLQPPSAQDRVASLTPPANDALPPPATPPAGYSVHEIRNAGEGIFGRLTSEFAAVINRAFDTFGQPNAYIMGDEGGGAFLAGLRYGEGLLYARVSGVETGPTKIYWQGPSLGADIGATGSRALFLVYNLNDVAHLYKRYPGIDGAAYVAGGFGFTVYRNENMVIVPIRTGLGLRLGASLAYLKFTERASWNPF
jgi:hypothetical protein